MYMKFEWDDDKNKENIITKDTAKYYLGYISPDGGITINSSAASFPSIRYWRSSRAAVNRPNASVAELNS